RAAGNFAPGIEVEQLDGHLANRGAGLLALLAPALAAQLVQPRGWAVLRHVAGRPVALELIDSVQRNIQTVAPLVFNNGDLDGALSHHDRLDAAIDADAVLEVHDVIALAQRQRVRADPARVLPRATNSPL